MCFFEKDIRLKATLYNKKRPVMVLDIENGVVMQIEEVLDTDFLPVVFQDDPTVESVNQWLSKRMMPENREGLKRARELFPAFDQKQKRNLFSLNDQYWVKYTKNESWDRLNYFTNRYGEETGKVFFLPWKVDEDALKKEQSPDITTNGVLTKRWIQDEFKDSHLIKAGSALFQQEPVSEVMASIVLDRLKIIPFVRYEMLVYGLRFCSKCKNFVTKDTEFVPASYLYKKEPKKDNESVYEHLTRMCANYKIKNVHGYVNAMIAADYIMGNKDRHLGNFGFLRNVETGEFEGFAPLFDSGSAFWNDARRKGKDGKPRKSFFAEYERSAVAQVSSRIDAKKVCEKDELYRLVDTYPCLTDKKRRMVREEIDRMSSILEQPIEDPIEELSR